MVALRAGTPAGPGDEPESGSKAVADPTRPAALPRRALDERFAKVEGRRLITVVAGPGFGKTTLIQGWMAVRPSATYVATAGAAPPDITAALLEGLRAAIPALAADADRNVAALAAESADGATVDAMAEFLGRLGDGLTSDFWFVVDDFHELEPDGASARLVSGFLRQAPSRLHLVIGSRHEVPFPIERIRAQGDVAEFGPPDLAFTPADVDWLLQEAGLGGDAQLTADLHRATAGWPATVRLAIEALRGTPTKLRAGAIAGLGRPGGPLFAYLAREVFERESEAVKRLIVTMGAVERVTPELCDRLGLAGSRPMLESLVARAMFVQRQGDAYALHDLVRDFAAKAWPLEPGVLRATLAGAAAWYRERDDLDESIRLLARAEDWPALVELLTVAGADAVRSGSARTLASLADRLPPTARTPAVAQAIGEAFATLGRSEQALAWLERAAGTARPLAPTIAWRLAMSHYLRDELDQVLAVHDATELEGAPAADVASLLAWTAGAARRLGDVERARSLAADALVAAKASGDDRALAAAHTAAGLAADVSGDLVASHDHVARALAAAERAGDLLQVVRIRINRASDLLESASYEASIRELGTALELSELAGFSTLSALALMNRGLAQWCLGRLEEASTDYEASIAAYRAVGSRELAYALIGRGDVYRERGDLELSRVAYEEGLALAERSGDRQALVPGLYQLAKVLVGEDPTRSAALADRAVEYGWPDRSWALNAKGWIAWFRGDGPGAIESASAAADAAREAGDRFGLAEALELRATASDDPGAARRGLEEALGIWESIGNRLHAAITRLALARRTGGPTARADAEAAEARLRSMGVRASPVGPAGLLTALARRAPDPIEVRTLGGFRVLRDGEVVALEEWHSRKARDLLKLLAARRGRPAAREILMEALWPDEEPGALSNRLSVAISMLRVVLDPDKRYPAERFVVSDKATASLDLEAVAVDVEAFFAHASAGFDLLRRGRPVDAAERLAAAEATYSGDFLEENPYDDWAVSLREQARSQYLAVARALARLAESAGDADAEVRYWLRLLERDPFDEEGHLALIDAHVRRGALGESRHAYRRYAARMEEIDVEAAPFPQSGASRDVVSS